MKKANIDSKTEYFINERGQIFDHKRNLVKGSDVNGLKVLSFLSSENQKNKIPFTRLVYKTFKPTEDISKSTILRKSLKCEYPYEIYNLKAVLNSEMPKNNDLEQFKLNLVPGGETFYAKFSETEIDILKNNLKYSTSLKKTSELYNVSSTSISRAKKKFLID